MVKIVLNNSRSHIVGALHPDPEKKDMVQRALRNALSYESPSKDFSPAFKSGQWDGKFSLWNPWKSSFPTGLRRRVIEVLERIGVPYTQEDKRPRPVNNAPFATAFHEYGRELRWYQVEAAKRAKDFQRGLLAIATGGGKTNIACEMIAIIGVAPVVYIVPSINLLLQTKKEFEKFLRIDGKPPKIGMAGDGICDLNPEGINIITYQTALMAYGEVYQKKASKRGKADSVVKAEEKKTTAQLEKEFADALEAYWSASSRAAKLCTAEQAAYDAAVAEADACDPRDEKKLARLEKAVKVKESALQRKRNAVAKKEHTAFKQAEMLLKGRKLTEARYADIRAVIEACQYLIVDEAHLAAAVIERLGELAINAFYRTGLTATPYREDNQEIRIEGALGRKLIEVSSSDLIEMGFQCPLNVYVVDVDYIENCEGYRDAYEKHIIRNWKRNWYIKRFAEDFHKEGMPVWIYVDELAHGETLEAMIPNSVFVAGGDDGDDEEVTEEEKNYRKAMLDKCERGEIILITTKWAATGIDAVKLRVGILAGSVQSASTIKQAIGRILRCVGKDIEESRENGKPNAIWISFMDEQEHLHKHSLRQVRVYKTERAWKVTRIR
jgi:superfamily II DNA or RNA helicase